MRVFPEDNTSHSGNVLEYGTPATLPFQAADDEVARTIGLKPTVESLPTNVFEFLASFEPRSIPDSKRQRVAEFVRDAAAAAAPLNEFTASQTTAPIVRLVSWAHVVRGLPLRYIVMLAPATVEQFLESSIATGDLSAGTARNYRAHLARVASALGVAVSGSPTPIARTQRAHPYTDGELEQWKLWARTRASVMSQQRANIILALMAGAGLGRAEILALTARRVIVDGDDTWIRVGGTRERVVPLLPRWQRRLKRHTEHLSGEDLVFPQPTSMNATGLKRWLHSMSVAPEPQRLRTTWIVALLASGESPEHLLSWSGIERGETLAGYIPFLPNPVSEEQRRELLHARARGTGGANLSSIWRMPRIEGSEGAASVHGKTVS